MEIVNGLALGSLIDPSPAPPPARIQMDGRYVRLEPVNPEVHGDALWNGVHGNDHLWAYLFAGPFDREGFQGYLEKIARADDPLFYAIVDTATGLAVGIASLMRIEPAHRVIEVGGILYTPALQQTRGATEAMYLLARYAFDDLGYRRYEWKCNDLNAPSRSAALRLGFTYEGTFRQMYIVKSRNRDTAWYSMLDSEWPVRKQAFEQWLDPANFDEAGNQKATLASLRS